MSGVRAIVLRTAGINCDEETVRALEVAGAEPDLLHLNALVAEPARLADYGILVLPGGFSYGDYVAAGRVYGVELRELLAGEVRAFVDAGGHVLGICNGFQVLVELGLLEHGGPGPRERGIALDANGSNRFEARWVLLQGQDCAAPWVEPGELLPVPVAHAEGRFVVRDDDVLERLVERRQVAWRYVSEDGGRPVYPANPNGSRDDVAGICDPSGRVMGLMPHPERNLTPWNHPLWTRLPSRGEGQGVRFFRRLVDAAASSSPAAPNP